MIDWLFIMSGQLYHPDMFDLYNIKINLIQKLQYGHHKKGCIQVIELHLFFAQMNRSRHTQKVQMSLTYTIMWRNMNCPVMATAYWEKKPS